MRKLTLVVALLACVLLPTPAFAETYEWHADQPKGAGNTPCVGRATFEGNTYVYGNWAPTDADGDAFDRRAYCHRILDTDMKMLFRWKWGQELPSSAIQVLQSP